MIFKISYAGLKFRSLVELKRSLLGNLKYSTSKSGETNNLDQESWKVLSKYVENSWNIDKEGEIKRRKNKWFKSEDMKCYPKKALYFSVENPKSKKKERRTSIESVTI